jgi:hypothetical protein
MHAECMEKNKKYMMTISKNAFLGIMSIWLKHVSCTEKAFDDFAGGK